MYRYTLFHHGVLEKFAEDLELAMTWVAENGPAGTRWEIWFDDDLVWSGTPEVAAELMMLTLDDAPAGAEAAEPTRLPPAAAAEARGYRPDRPVVVAPAWPWHTAAEAASPSPGKGTSVAGRYRNRGETCCAG
jgi:hypothetical protein